MMLAEVLLRLKDEFVPTLRELKNLEANSSYSFEFSAECGQTVITPVKKEGIND